MKRFAFVFAASSLLTVTASANAQAWLRDRAGTQGPGARAGDLEIHPGIGIEVGYDSNYFQRSGDSPTVDPVGSNIVNAAVLRVTPSLHVSTISGLRGGEMPKISFAAGVSASYTQFLDHTGPAQLDRSDTVGLNGDLLLQILPGRPWSVVITDTFVRTAQPGLESDAAAGLDNDNNRASIEAVYTRPGGLFDWHLGYAIGVTFFEEASDLTNYRQEAFTRGRWKFLPRTALVYDLDVQYISFDGGTTANGRPASYPFRARLGLSGLVTDRLALLAMAGWGASFYNGTAGDFDSVIGQVEARYFLSGAPGGDSSGGAVGTSSFAVGANRDFAVSYIGNYYERDRLYVSIAGSIAQRFYLSLDAGIAAFRYPEVTGIGTANAASEVLSQRFTEWHADATAFAEYRVRDWLSFNATLSYIGNLNTHIIGGGSTTTTTPYDLAFNRYQALAGIRIFF